MNLAKQGWFTVAAVKFSPRRLICLGGFVLALFSLVACSDANQSTSSAIDEGPSLVWNFSLWGNPRAGTEAVDALARIIEARTAGEWVIVPHYGEALSKARENLDGLAIHAFEGAMACNFYHRDC